MAKGKSTFCAWVCSETGAANYVTTYNKKAPNTTKEKMKYSPTLRKRTKHVRKDVKKG